MIKVIETNLSIDNNNNIADHQSRIIEVDSWDEYIKEIKEAKCVLRMAILGVMQGCTIPKNAQVLDLKYDDAHLSCDVIGYEGKLGKKLAYVIR